MRRCRKMVEEEEEEEEKEEEKEKEEGEEGEEGRRSRRRGKCQRRRKHPLFPPKNHFQERKYCAKQYESTHIYEQRLQITGSKTIRVEKGWG